MNLPIGIAEKLILLQNGEKIPASKLKHSLIDTMLSNGILDQHILSRSKKLIFLRSPKRLNDYLYNHFGINDLYKFVSLYKQDNALRSDFVAVSSDSKLRTVRTFKGFLINSYSPIEATLNHEQLLINPPTGSFQFIYDFDCFSVPEDITIVGIENPENFRYINRQKHLFDDIKPMFISRYPQNQNKDLIKWLQSIPNPYLHFGDLDFAGIAIYLNEYKKYLKNKAVFFVPKNVKDLLEQFGNRELYDNQKSNFSIVKIDEIRLNQLIAIIHECKKGLEQEVFIKMEKLCPKLKK